jgi:hypothetical protein
VPPSEWNPIVKLRLFLLAACLLTAQSALAETHVFIVDGADGYEIDRCLASGEPCGAAAAAAICHSRRYEKALSYGLLHAAEFTGSVKHVSKGCKGRSCPHDVAVTCSR